MAQQPSGGSNSGKGSSSSGSSRSSSSSKTSSSKAAPGKSDPIERLAGKVPAAKADRAQGGKLDIKGKWTWSDGNKMFEG